MKLIAINCKSIDGRFKTGSEGSHLDMKDFVPRIFECDDNDKESSEGFECTIDKNGSDSTPQSIAAVELLLPEQGDNRESCKNRTTSECSSQIIFSQNRLPSNGDCNISKVQAFNSDEKIHHLDGIKDNGAFGDTESSEEMRAPFRRPRLPKL